jgi:hypothetical protein
MSHHNHIAIDSKLKAKLQALALIACLFAAPSSWAALTTYNQDFEGLNQASSTALSDDGWLVGANVFDSGGNYLYGYFSFPAPNGGAAFSGIDIGQGGLPQGAQQLITYSDYNNADHAAGNLIQASIFKEQVIGAGDLGSTSVFSFDSKQGNIGGSTTAEAFVQVLDSVGGSYATLGSAVLDTTSIGANWAEGLALNLLIDGSWDGQLLQFGFRNTASNYDDSGVFYDNIALSASVVPIPAAVWLFGSGLGLLGWMRRRAVV